MDKGCPELRGEIINFKKRALRKVDSIPIISISKINTIAQKFNLPPKDVEIIALQEEIMPSRYRRNFDTLNFDEQITLLSSKVAVVGCGGLGGNIIELLARLGLGNIIAVDGDIFKESNLNRQLLCSEKNIGKEKTRNALSRIKHINSSINAQSYSQFIGVHNIAGIIQDVDVVVDALDNIPSRFILEKACKKQNIPFIHGAINGLQGQVTTIFPEDKGLTAVYGSEDRYHKNPPSNQISVLSVTPSLIASLQVTEVLKVLLKRGNPLRNKLFLINLEETDFSIVEIL